MSDPAAVAGDRTVGRGLDALVIVVLAGVAAVLRFVGLPGRGTWDADQGEQMLVLLGLVRSGSVPLLGPPSSIGEFHHGATYYYLLAPTAAASDADPVAAAATLAAAGVVAVLATWWLARRIGGPVAGLAAGATIAVSATSVALSTSIWNPALAPAASALALAAAWRAYDGRHPRWWLVTAAAAAIAMQAHLVAGLLLVPLVALYAADLGRTASGHRGRLLAIGMGSAAVLLLAHVPQLAHELGHGFAQLRSIGDVLGGQEGGVDLLARVVVVPIRIVSWPLVGLFTDAVALAVVATAVVVSLLLWRARAGRTSERAAMLWLGGTLAWSWAALVFVAPSLGTVVRELPVDHYHAYLDPVVATVLGVGVAALLRARIPGRVAAVAIVAPLLAWNVATQPPLVHPDGGWPAGEAAGDRIVAGADGAPIAFVAIPDFKGPQAYRFPVERVRAEVVPDADALPDGGLLVVLCDDLFREAVGAPCGGPAEAREIEALGRPAVLADRFEPSPGRLLSLYRVGGSTP